MMTREWFEWFEVVRSWHLLLELTENDKLKNFESYTCSSLFQSIEFTCTIQKGNRTLNSVGHSIIFITV